MADEILLSLKGDVALFTMRIHQLLKRLGNGESRLVWRKLRLAFESLQSASTRRDAGGIESSVKEIGRLVALGNESEGAYDELFDMVDRRARLVGQEWKRLMEMRQLLTVEEALGLVMAVIDVVRDVVDMKVFRKINEKVAVIIGVQGRVADPADSAPRSYLPVQKQLKEGGNPEDERSEI